MLDWLGNAIADVNYWAVFWAVVSTFVVGYVYYHERVFGEIWRKSIKLKRTEMDASASAVLFGGTFVFNLFIATFLQAMMIATDTAGWWSGLVLGAVFGLIFAGFSHTVHAMFELKSSTYFGLAIGHDVLTYAAMGAIMGAFLA
jgi:hypothetical protein